MRGFLTVLFIAASVCGQNPTAERAIQAEIESLYAAVERRDTMGLRQYWHTDSPFFEEFELQTAALMKTSEPLGVRNLVFTTASSTNEVYRQRLRIEIRGKQQNLTFLFAIENQRWKLWRIRPSEDDFLHQLINAESDARRNQLVNANPELQNTALCEAIAYIVFELSDAGRHDLAYRLADIATASAERVQDKKCYGRMLHRRAGITYSKGELAAATKEYFDTLKYARGNGDRNLEAIALYYLSIAFGAQNNPALSTDYLNKAAEVAATVENPELRRQILNIRALNTVDLKEKMAAFEQLLRMLREAGNMYGEAAVLGNIAYVHADLGEPEKAIAVMSEAAAKFRQVNFKNELVTAYMGLSDFNVQLGRFQEAIDWSERAYEICIQIGRSPVEPLSRKFEINRRFNRPLEAEKNAREAIRDIESSRPKRLLDSETQRRFLQGNSTHYENLILILGDLKKSDEALQASELFKARSLFDIVRTGKPSFLNLLTEAERSEQDRLKQAVAEANLAVTRERQRDLQKPARIAELEAGLKRARLEYEDFQLKLYAIKPELNLRRGDFQPISLEETNALFPDNRTAFLEFAVTGEKTFLFVITRDGVKPRLVAHTIELNKESLEKLVREFRSSVSDSAINLDFKNHARRLFETLIAPAAAQLSGKSSLVIIPDGFLWEVPFQALMTESNKYLIEDFDLSYAPSLTVLREMRRTERRSKTPLVLAFGNPRTGLASTTKLEERRGSKLADLPSAEREVDFIGRLYGPQKTRVYKRDKATESVFKQTSGNIDILHFATHAVLDNDRPMNSAIVLSTSENSTEDGLLEAWELTEMSLDAELAVLSGCDTGRGVFPGEGIVGLSWAFFSAGVPRVVASQWQVESASTTELMIEFHRALRRPGPQTVSKALQGAMLKQMRNSRYRHPFYWAGFVTIGK